MRSFFCLVVRIALLFLICLLSSCQGNTSALDPDKVLKNMQNHYAFVQNIDSVFSPRSIEHPSVKPRDWTSGFFPGMLWYLAAVSDSELWISTADRFTRRLEPMKDYEGTHDLGFILYNSYGKGYQLTGDTTYKKILIEGAYALSSRYDQNVGAIKSWDFGTRFGWQYPVIIDNMMNLEYLFWAAKATGNQRFYQIAYNHAKTTLDHHFREDHSSFHVVDFDTITYQPRWKGTHQGLGDSTAWARGQAWGLYGFTMAYRETGDSSFLEKANQIADFILSHPNLPSDKIPNWDFDAVVSDNTPRDVSAATIIASALIELQAYSQPHHSRRYLLAAEEMLANVNNKYKYRSIPRSTFYLDRSTGNKPVDGEVEMPIIYAEYYFIEALHRLVKLKNQAVPGFISEEERKTLPYAGLAQVYGHMNTWWNEGPFSVIQKKFTPPSGNKQDYMSMGIYWWPNEDTEDGLPYIRRDGQVNPEVKKITDANYLKNTATYSFKLALAYRNTGFSPFAEKSSDMLKSWFINDSTKMNPHLKFGQGVPGITDGRRYGIIESRYTWQCFEAAKLILGTLYWSQEDHLKLKAWFCKYLDWLLTSELGKLEGKTANNHHTWYNAQVGHLAVICERDTVLKDIIEDTKVNVLDAQLEYNGSQPEELTRTRSLSYSIMNLYGYFHLCSIAEEGGENLWEYETPKGVTIKDALNFIVDNLLSDEGWPYPQIREPEYDLLINLLKLAQQKWPQEDYSEIARKIMERYSSANNLRYWNLYVLDTN